MTPRCSCVNVMISCSHDTNASSDALDDSSSLALAARASKLERSNASSRVSRVGKWRFSSETRSCAWWVFFVYVGMSIDIGFVADNFGRILMALAALMVIKTVVLLAIASLFRIPLATGIQVAFLLAHGGEFALILLAAASAAGILDPATNQFTGSNRLLLNLVKEVDVMN